eukprot:Hpha_TRINITY_DN15562_c1_g5::TRINITY_DN15562_c1_g5_i1::g.103816::m.103816
MLAAALLGAAGVGGLPVGTISAADMRRAVNKVPRVEFKGSGVAHMAHTLNTHLQRMATANTVRLRQCEEMDHAELHALQLQLVRSSHPAFQQLYDSTKDNRRYRFAGEAELITEYAQQARMVATAPALAPVLRDSMCRESVMWYVHHLRAEEKRELHASSSFVLPTLPETEMRPEPALVQASPAEAKAVYQSYNDSLQCSTCHSLKFPTNHTWPSDAGINKKTGEKLPAWPDSFSVEFVLEVTTEPGQKGLPNITNATGNTFHYAYDRKDSNKSRAVNIHDTCPFFHTKACNIHHHPDGIYLHINPKANNSLCCLFQDVAVIPPYWTTWGEYVDTYPKGAPVPGEAAPNWEGWVADRYIYGDAAQLDEHDLHVRADDPHALIRFHATLPPPNDHSHGYWHILSDMHVGPQDPELFRLPPGCLPSCGLSRAPAASSSAHAALFPWAGVDVEQLQQQLSKL